MASGREKLESVPFCASLTKLFNAFQSVHLCKAIDRNEVAYVMEGTNKGWGGSDCRCY